MVVGHGLEFGVPPLSEVLLSVAVSEVLTTAIIVSEEVSFSRSSFPGNLLDQLECSFLIYFFIEAGSFEVKQGSSSLLAGSGEHDAWNTKPSTVGWSGESTSPALSSVAVNQDHSRSPARLRNQQYESPQTSSEIPRSSSPYYSIPRQGTVGQVSSMSQSPNNKSYLDPASAASFGETLDFQNAGRGRGLEMGQTFGGGRHLSSVLAGAIEDEDPNHINRGRVVSNPRGVIPTGAEIIGTSVSSASRSESLPPQQRANSTPPTYNPNQASQDTAGYGAYTHVPTSHPASHGPNPNVGTYPAAAQGRYTDLTRETRQAEMLAHFRQISVEDENDQFPGGRRLPFTTFNQSPNNPGNLNYPSQPSFAEYPYQQRPAQPALQNSSLWAQEDGNYGRGQDGFNSEQYAGDGGYPEGLRRPPYDRIGAMSPGDQSVEFQRRGLSSPYYPNGSTPPPPPGDFRSSSRGAPTRTPPSGQPGLNHEKLRQRLLVTQQQLQSPHMNQSQIMMRDQLYRNQQFPVAGPYDYAFQGLRMHMPNYSGSPISPLVAPTHPARRNEDIGNLRSALLEEFRSNSKSNKRYELKVSHLPMVLRVPCLGFTNKDRTSTIMLWNSAGISTGRDSYSKNLKRQTATRKTLSLPRSGRILCN